MEMKAKNNNNKNKVGSELGCGLMGRILHLKSHKMRKASVHSLPLKNAHSDDDDVKTEESKVARKSFTHTEPPHKLSGAEQKPARMSVSIIHHQQQQPCTNRNNQHQRHSDVADGEHHEEEQQQQRGCTVFESKAEKNGP